MVVSRNDLEGCRLLRGDDTVCLSTSIAPRVKLKLHAVVLVVFFFFLSLQSCKSGSLTLRPSQGRSCQLIHSGLGGRGGEEGGGRVPHV